LEREKLKNPIRLDRGLDDIRGSGAQDVAFALAAPAISPFLRGRLQQH
jgi:hypothetical protein